MSLVCSGWANISTPCTFPFSVGRGCSTPGSVVDADLTTAVDDWASPRAWSLVCDGKVPASSVLGSGRPEVSSTNKY